MLKLTRITGEEVEVYVMTDRAKMKPRKTLVWKHSYWYSHKTQGEENKDKGKSKIF